MKTGIKRQNICQVGKCTVNFKRRRLVITLEDAILRVKIPRKIIDRRPQV